MQHGLHINILISCSCNLSSTGFARHRKRSKGLRGSLRFSNLAGQQRIMAPKVAKAEPKHPRYQVMITDAIKTLKERTGSSAPAIAKVRPLSAGSDGSLRLQKRV